MFDFQPDETADTASRYRQLGEAASALITGESDPIANMANVAALIWQFVPDLNWAGFYRRIGEELVVGPFIGKPACVRIPFGQGVCGATAASGETRLVADVHAFPGHIACDAASRSELVVPVHFGETLVAVIDLDSPVPARFTKDDARGIEDLARRIAEAITG